MLIKNYADSGSVQAFYTFTGSNLISASPGSNVSFYSGMSINQRVPTVPLFAAIKNNNGKLVILHIPSLVAASLQIEIWALESSAYSFSDVMIASNSLTDDASFYFRGVDQLGAQAYYLVHVGSGGSLSHSLYDYGLQQVEISGMLR